MISINRIVTAAAAVFALATVCPAQEPTDLGKGAGFQAKKIEMKDKGEIDYLLSFTAGKEFEATTDGTKNTDVHLYVYDEAGTEVGKDDYARSAVFGENHPGERRKVQVRHQERRGDNTVTFGIKVAGS
jgi:hypothetical protein